MILVLLLSALVRPIPAAAQQFHLCSQFSTDDDAAILGQPIVDTQEYAEAAHWDCQHVAVHAETLLEIWKYAGAEEATSQMLTGIPIAGLGEASTLTKSDDGTSVLLRVLKLPYVITVGATFDDQPVEVATDQLLALAQGVLDTLPGATQELDSAPAIGGRTPATIDPCSIVNEDDVRAALAAVSSPGTAYGAGAAVPVSWTRVPWTEEPPANAGASSEACKVVWGSNSTLVVLVTRQTFDLMALLGGTPDADLGGDQAIVVDEVPYVLKGDIAVLAETGTGGTLRLHREIVKRAATRL